jgi:hypothetical protein
MSTAIRPARPEESAFLARVILAAARSHVGRGFWDLKIEGEDGERLEVLERMACAPRVSFCHHSTFLVAEVDGQPAGALGGYDPEAPGLVEPGAAIDAVLGEMGWSAAERVAASRRTAPFALCGHDEPDDAWIIEWGAVLPQWGGRGLMAALLEAQLDAGRCRGRALAQISMLLGNASAQRAFERVGFSVVAEKRHPAFQAAVGCPGMACLQRNLGVAVATPAGAALHSSAA